ncbi:unnamed protein product [Durusdinium trenchii]|uniref:Uncharacterized protein n=1 Tax=Durusdinium trenchii TaxID=1381693 RepID=A0ABP0H717_9DINO
MPARLLSYGVIVWLATLPGTFGDGGVQRWPHTQVHIRLTGDDLDPQEQQALIQAVKGLVGGLQLCLIAVEVLIGGLIYHSCTRRPPSPSEIRPSGGSGFDYGLCECCHSWETSCWAIWCPWSLWSATASSPKSNFWAFTFWQFVFLTSGFFFFGGLLRVLSPLLCLLVLLGHKWVLVRHRQHLRQKYGMLHSTCLSITEDACIWCYCIPCAAMQEALQVDYVGDPLSAPLTASAPPDPPRQLQMVGQVVRVDGRQAFLQVQ